MKMFSLILATAIIVSCNQSSANMTVEKVTVDSLVNNWTNTWNNHDSAGARNLFMNEALLIDDDLISNNIEDISAEWIHPNINAVNNFKTIKLQEWSVADRAGYTGNYEFDYGVKDSAMGKAKGVFTLNWIKTEKGEWKITTADIHSIISK